MRTARYLGVALGALVLGIVGTAADPTGSKTVGYERIAANPNSDFTPPTLMAFSAYRVYGLGDAYGNLRLQAIDRVSAPTVVEGAPGLPPQEYVDLAYGTCKPTGDADAPSCSYPLEIQTWRACSRSLWLYHLGQPDGTASVPYTLAPLRSGATAAVFADGKVEVYTGDVTVVIFGDSTDEELKVAEGLSGMTRSAAQIRPGDPLPPPVRGAMDGRLAC